MTDLNALRQRMTDSGMTVKAIAQKSGILRETLYNRLNGTTEFNASEMLALSDTLRLTDKERDAIFFAREVKLKET